IANNSGAGVGGVQGTNDGSITFRNSIVANNVGVDCDPDRFISQGYNLSSDTTCHFTNTASGDQQGVNARLGTLANNGGLTRTLALLAGRPAIDAGNPATPLDGANGRCT